MSEPLPQLLDARHLAAELGVTRAAAEKIMRQLPIVQVPGLRKTYSRRADVAAFVERSTFAKDEVPEVRRPGAGGEVLTTPHTHRPAA